MTVLDTGYGLDRHFGAFIARLDRSGEPIIRAAAEALGRAVLDGAVCLDLRQWSPEAAPDIRSDPDRIQRRLAASTVIGCPGERTPLILDDAGRLYLYRLWSDETRLAEYLLKLATETAAGVNENRLSLGVARHFPPDGGSGPDWQAVAAATAVLRRFTVVSGGPGTGKTYTIARTIALLADQAGPMGMRIVLTAPTGKAAVRLRETVGALGDAPGVTVTAMTVHRLLGIRPGGDPGHPARDRPIRADVVVVDEASMISLPLLARLVQGLAPHARLILVGDHHQLASVSPGAVLGDICARNRMTVSESFARRLAAVLPQGTALQTAPTATDRHSGLGDSLVFLERPYRFAAGGAVDRLRQAVLTGDGAALMAAVDGGDPTCQWHDRTDPGAVSRGILQAAVAGYGPVISESTVAAALAGLGRFRILAATRTGRTGADGINRLVIDALRRSGQIRPMADAGPFPGPGTPIQITRNDYHLGLFNGDAGILWEADDDMDSVVAVFASAGEGIRSMAAVQLPPAEVAFAVTVHKSQGSEFDTVHLVLPPTAIPLVTRELLYTAVSRARHQIHIWGGASVLQAGAAKRIQRRSGLRDALWGKDGDGSAEGG